MIPLSNSDSLMILLVLVKDKYLKIKNVIAFPNDEIISVIINTSKTTFLMTFFTIFLEVA